MPTAAPLQSPEATAGEKNKTVPILFNRRECREELGSEVSQERRRGPDRRTRVARALLYGSFYPRRLGPRRDGEHGLGAIDWHHPWWFAIATLILTLCAADAVLTVVLISRGAYELNPVLAPLIDRSAMLFVVVKVGLTGIAVVLLTLLSRVKAFGRMPVALFLYAVLAGYGTLIAYELGLLGWL
jgi:8-oxo-dGTP pyrophosphatase MutT (NUDIX family)